MIREPIWRQVGGAGFGTAYPLCRTRRRQYRRVLLSYEAKEDPVGTTDLAIFVLRFFALFVALLSAFLSAFFAIFRNLLCSTMKRSISRFGYPSHFKSSGSLATLAAIGRDAGLVPLARPSQKVIAQNSSFAKHIFRSSVVICWAFHAQTPLIQSALFGKIEDEQGERVNLRHISKGFTRGVG